MPPRQTQALVDAEHWIDSIALDLEFRNQQVVGYIPNLPITGISGNRVRRHQVLPFHCGHKVCLSVADTTV